MLAQNGRDFIQFDPEATDLHLSIGAAQKLERPIWQIAHKVACLVEAALTVVAEWIADEFLFGQFRSIKIAACDTGAADMEFARDQAAEPTANPAEARKSSCLQSAIRSEHDRRAQSCARMTRPLSP